MDRGWIRSAAEPQLNASEVARSMSQVAGGEPQKWRKASVLPRPRIAATLFSGQVRPAFIPLPSVWSLTRESNPELKVMSLA